MRHVKFTARQLAILALIRLRIAAQNAPPSIREIAREFGIGSPNGAMAHIRALRRKGVLRKSNACTSRTLSPSVFRLPYGGGID